jgi:hypothetical protein
LTEAAYCKRKTLALAPAASRPLVRLGGLKTKYHVSMPPTHPLKVLKLLSQASGNLPLVTGGNAAERMLQRDILSSFSSWPSLISS